VIDIEPARIELDGVCHTFESTAVLEDVSLTVEPGEFVAVIGPSGCGKSTLLRMLAGLMRPRKGTVYVSGRDAAGKPGSVSYLPQNDLLLPWRRAFDNAALAGDIHRNRRETIRAHASKLFEQFGLAGFERAWPHELSGGMRQRVAVLRTFLLDSPVLGLDEPFGALDAITRRDMQEWLAAVWQQDKRTTVMITHDVEEALALATRLVVFSARPGRVVDDFLVTEEMRTQRDSSQDFIRAKQRVMNELRASPIKTS
jgi:ABC-type nitrate/sulfonate/bicarbonate transport system ATPase subunit